MAWPVGPSNGATTTVNGVLYVYNSTSGSWSPTASSATDFNVGNITATGNISGLNESATGNATITGNATVGSNLTVNGNIILNGAPVSFGTISPAYLVVGLTTGITGFGSGSTVVFDTVIGNVNSQTSYSTSTGVFTLTAGITYDMSFTPSFISFSNTTAGFLCYDWVDATTNALLDTTGIGTGTSIPSTETGGQIDNPTARVIYKPTTNQTVKIRCTNATGTATLRGGIGTQAVVRPLNLSVAVQATASGTVNVDYIQAGKSADQTSVAKNTDITFNVSPASSVITQTNGVFTLTAGKTYLLEASLCITSFDTTSSYIWWSWVDATTNTQLDTTNGSSIATGSSGVAIPATWTTNGNYVGTAKIIYTPVTNQTVKVRATDGSGTCTVLAIGTKATIKQINPTFAINTLDISNVTLGNLTSNGTATISNATTITYTPASTTGVGLTVTGKDTQGGTGYFDFLRATNTTSGATNPTKTFRLNNTGAFEIINSAYSATLMSLSNAGAMSVGGSYQVSGKKAVNGPAFSAYADNTLQTITSGSQQKVLFQVEEFDTDNCFASSRFTPTVEGYYQLNAEVRLDGSSGTGEIMIVLYKNTSEHKRGTNQSGTSIATNFWAMQVSSLVYANGTTDYFEIKVQQTSGSSMTVTAVNNPAITWFNGAMVRGA